MFEICRVKNSVLSQSLRVFSVVFSVVLTMSKRILPIDEMDASNMFRNEEERQIHMEVTSLLQDLESIMAG